MVSKGWAPLTTIASDGTVETNNKVGKNQTVLNNVGNPDNRWAVDNKTFNRKYEKDPIGNGVYKPKGGPMNAAQISEPISFTAPWGERMNIDKGGYLLQDPNNPNDVYGISGKDFDSTYRFDETKSYLNRVIKESVKRVLREGWVSTEDTPTDEIFNDLVSKFSAKQIWYNIQKEGGTPYEFFTDYIRDYYDVTIQQCDELLTRLEQYYGDELPYFTYQQKTMR